MKKVLFKGTALIVSGMFLLGGCGSAQQNQESQAENETAENRNSETGTPENDIAENQTLQSTEWEIEEAETEGSDTIGNETIGGSAPTIVITQEKKEWYTDDGGQMLLEAEADRVEAVGDGFEALNAALSEQWSGLRDNYEELEMAQEHYDSLKDENYFMSYYVSDGVVAYRIDNRVASFCNIYGGYSGGAHDYYGFDGVTFDVKSGKKLQIEDILSDADGFYDKAVSYITEELEENYGDALFPYYKEVVEEDTFGESSICWYLDHTGIVIEYGLYSVVPYVAGAPEVTLPYDAFAEYIKEDYRKPCSSLIARVDENKDVSQLIGESGKVMLVTEYDEEYATSEVTVVSGNSSESVGTFARFMNAYVIKREDGRCFLIFYCDYASDDFVTYVYEVTEGSVRECDKLDGAAFSGLSFGSSANFHMGTDRVGLYKHLDVLGTYAGEMVYLLTDDGKLAQTEEVFAIDTPYDLTTVKELPVTLEGVETTIPAGRTLRITGTDDAGTAYFRLDTGETGMIQYVRDDGQWQLLIDGVPENEYFEQVPYFG